MRVAEILGECRRAGLTLRLDGTNIRIRPKSNLTDNVLTLIKAHKQDLVDALLDRHEATEERAAILEHDHGLTHQQADMEASRRIKFVSCGSCVHWTGDSPCGVGMVTSGDIYPGMRMRICGFHTAKGRDQ